MPAAKRVVGLLQLGSLLAFERKVATIKPMAEPPARADLITLLEGFAKVENLNRTVRFKSGSRDWTLHMLLIEEGYLAGKVKIVDTEHAGGALTLTIRGIEYLSELKKRRYDECFVGRWRKRGAFVV